MKVAVVGLGVEGKKAVKSLLKRGHQVYATDLKEDVLLDEEVDMDLGFHDLDKIFSADAVALSPGLWRVPLGEKIKNSQILLSDKITTHRSLYTIGVTGTNGKSTTAWMIKKILEKSGLKVLLGGNAGGGFQGYTELILEADTENYQAMIVEICDMTLDFADHCFDLDLVVVTNLGPDHLDYHGSLSNYRHNLAKFLSGKRVILNQLDKNLVQLGSEHPQCIFYGESEYQIPLFGKFNRVNAGAAETTARYLKIDESIIKGCLENFQALDGRIRSFNVEGSHILVGKTDNVAAIQEVLLEERFPVMIIGTPRAGEEWRFQILEEIVKSKPEIIILFPGLEDTTSQAASKLKSLNYEGEIKILKDLNSIPELIKPYLSLKNIFIGGNGQQKIIKIQKIIATMAKGR